MKAQSLSINLNGPCNATCPFCISALTWHPDEHGNDKLLDNLDKALNFAKYHNVDTVLITGSGEPTLNKNLIQIIQQIYQSGIPKIELQTNGTQIYDNDQIEIMRNQGLTHISLSIASTNVQNNNKIMGLNENFNYINFIQKSNNLDIITRISINIIANEWTNNKNIKQTFNNWCQNLYDVGAKQLTIREVGIPKKPINNIEKSKQILQFTSENQKLEKKYHIISNIYKEIKKSGTKLMEFSYGTMTYDYQGLSVCLASCMTDNTKQNKIRSFILQPDGHIYHSWNFKGSILL